MASPLDGSGIRSLLLDIEGTTSPIAFVHDVLFPYARARVAAFLDRNARASGVKADVERLRQEHGVESGSNAELPAWRDDTAAATLSSVVSYVGWLMDRDRKSTGLKSLQGRIWEEGYRTGTLTGEVYPDVPRALGRWQGQGRDIAIFSSGSVLAQRLLFGHTAAGDLTPFLRSYFDTTTGPKAAAESYQRIAGSLQRAPAEMLFASDTVAELEAARDAGLATVLCVRGAEPPDTKGHAVVHGFDVVFP